MIDGVRDAVAESLERGAFPLVLGGDCPVLLGCLAAMTAGGGAPRVLYVDGHEDAWSAAASTTGEAADMDLGWLLGTTSADLRADLRGRIPILQPDDVIILGARDEDELADAGIESLQHVVQVVRPDAITDDPDAVGRDAVSALERRGPWWLHVDLDVLATDSLSAIDYPQAGGLDWTTLSSLTSRALASPNVMGWTVTIYNPDLDPGGGGAKRIVRYVTEVLGHRDPPESPSPSSTESQRGDASARAQASAVVGRSYSDANR
jgi:arginase